MKQEKDYKIKKIYFPRMKFANGSINLDFESRDLLADKINRIIDYVVSRRDGDNQTIADMCVDDIEDSLELEFKTLSDGQAMISMEFRISPAPKGDKYQRIKFLIQDNEQCCPTFNIGHIMQTENIPTLQEQDGMF